VLVVDRNGLVQFTGGDWHVFFPKAETPPIGESIVRLWGEAPALLHAARRALEGEEVVEQAATNGHTMHLRFAALHAGTPEVAGCTVMWTDTPAEELRSSAGQLQLLFHQIPGAVWMTDRELHVTSMVGRLRESAGLRLSALLGQTVNDIVEKEQADPQILVHHLAALEGKKSSFRYSFRDRLYEIEIEPLYNGRPEPIGCIAASIDVTERREAEERLARSETRLLNAQRAAHVGSWEWDVSTDVVTWSPELFRIYGISPAEFDGTYQSFLTRVHREDLEKTKNTIFEALRAGKSFVYDHRVVRPDWSVRMLHTRGDVVTDDHGKVVRLVGSCWDVTDRWEADQALQRSVSLLRATLESTADGLLVVDRTGRIEAFNRRFLAMWNIPEELADHRDDIELQNRVLEQLEDSAAFQLRVEELYRHPEAESLDVVRFKDGRIFERYSQPQRLGTELVGRVWSFRDVTERERLLRSTILLSDASRLLASLDIENALEAMAQLTLPFLGNGCAIDLFTASGGPRRLLSISREPSQPVVVELPRAIYGGHATIFMTGGVSCISAPLMMQGELLGAISFLAPPERHYMEADLKLVEELAHRVELAMTNARLFQQAKDALQARDQFLSIAAHEIRGPVAGLHLAVQTLNRHAVLTASAHRALSVIEREDRRISRLVDELLDVSRMRQGLVHFELEEVDLTEVTREVAARLTTEITKSGSTLSVTAEPGIIGFWDRLRLEQLVTNLLTNAAKFGQGKPIEINVTATPDVAHWSIRDQGIGIADEKQRMIFEPFERAVSGRHYGGLGLGLYIVRRIVEGLGGTIRVESRPGEGTAFSVELPRHAPRTDRPNGARR